MSKNVIHPAHSISFGQLIVGLEEECVHGNINKRHKGPLTQYTYTQQCTYTQNWNLYTQVARGIIVDNERIVALPFPKFFNLSEKKTIIPDLPFHCYEKVDGSLIICYFYDGEWQTATKGSFNSDQAVWARDFLKKHQLFDGLRYNTTYLFEAIYPENRIVISYSKEALVFLGAYNNILGEEFLDVDWSPKAKTYSFAELDHVIDRCSTLFSNEEGFVVRYEDGTRIKLKGAEYCRLHAIISNITPLAIWEMMVHGDNIELIRREIPEEFLTDFDSIYEILSDKIMHTMHRINNYYYQTKNLTDKELGLILHTLDSDIRKLIFSKRKTGSITEGKARDGLYRLHRPTGNRLEGYVPSNSLNMIQEDG